MWSPNQSSNKPNAFPPQGAGIEQTHEQARLALGLLKLDNPRGEAPLPPSTVPVSLPLPDSVGATGAALSRLIAILSARTIVYDGSDLRARAGALWQGPSPRLPDAFFYTDIHVMNIISHAIEERVIADRLHCEVYAGFQRLSLLQPQTRRYRALLESAEFVSVFGLNDLTTQTSTTLLQHPRLLRFVIDPLLGTGLEWFWFVVVEDPRFRTALLAQHIAGNLWAGQQNARSYAGLWTFDDALVRDIVSTIRQAGRALYYHDASRQAHP